MVVVAAAWIEVRLAGWAPVLAVQILPNAKFCTAASAQHGGLIPIAFGPHLYWMASQCVMAILAGVVDAATLHLDRNDVLRLAVVSAASLRIEADSAHIGLSIGHGYRVEDP
jgi:hypothetical protein